MYIKLMSSITYNINILIYMHVFRLDIVASLFPCLYMRVIYVFCWACDMSVHDRLIILSLTCILIIIIDNYRWL